MQKDKNKQKKKLNKNKINTNYKDKYIIKFSNKIEIIMMQYKIKIYLTVNIVKIM